MNNTDKLREDFESKLINEFRSDSRGCEHLVNLRNGDSYAVGWIEMRWRAYLIEAKDKEIEEYKIKNVELKIQLSTLLTTVHRDGGHYEEKHGTDKAVNDAILKVAANCSVIDDISRLKTTLDLAREYISCDVENKIKPANPVYLLHHIDSALQSKGGSDET